MPAKTRPKRGTKKAAAKSGKRWATLVWVKAVLSSSILRIFPDGYLSKKAEGASKRASIPAFFKFASRRKAIRWVAMQPIK